MKINYHSKSKTGGINLHTEKIKIPEHVFNVIRISDIILEILDARFIEETRNLEIEEIVRQQGKKLVYVLNKSDLINEIYIKRIIEEKKLNPFALVSCRLRRGIKNLRDLIKKELKRMDIGHKTANVGIVGYPNTGKSSLINLLSGKSSAKTSSQSGFTKGIQKIRLTKGIHLLDTPGIIPDKEIEQKLSGKHIRINAISSNRIKEPEMAISGLIGYYPGLIENYYGINARGNAEELVEKLGRKKNFILKGNQVDIDRTARVILKDWQEGRIKIGDK